MGYRGKTYPISFQSGGLNYDQNVDLVNQESMIAVRNIDLHNGGRESRGSTTKINSTAVSGTPEIRGLYDFQLASSSFQMFLGSDGGLYKDTSTTIKTGMSTSNFASFEVFEDEVFVCDGDTTPQTWDGAAGTSSNITTPATDWSGSNQPFQVIAHGRGASRRLWFLYGSAVYYSSLGDGKEVNAGTSGKIQIDTSDAVGLKGGIEFGDRLIVFGRRKAFVIDDTDSTTSNWGYEKVSWDGGVAHWRLIVRTPNDIVCMAEDGEIYSVQAVESYGDYKKASLARPEHIDRYIRENIKMSEIEKFHGVYDPNIRAIRFFMVSNNSSNCDVCLKYYIDLGVWSLDDGSDATSGYDASCSALVRESAGEYQVYTGDYSGFLWKLNQSDKNDDSSSYYSGFTTPNLSFGNYRVSKHYRRLVLIVRPQDNYELNVKVWVDGVYKDTLSVSLEGTGSSFPLPFPFELGSSELQEKSVELGYIGKRIKFEIYNNVTDQSFFVSAGLVDYRETGVRYVA